MREKNDAAFIGHICALSPNNAVQSGPRWGGTNYLSISFPTLFFDACQQLQENKNARNSQGK